MLQIIQLAFAVSAISITVTKPHITATMRAWIRSKSEWFGKLFSCHYCFSHWVSLGVVSLSGFRIGIGFPLLDFMLTLFTLVGISALITGIITYFLIFPTDEAEHP